MMKCEKCQEFDMENRVNIGKVFHTDGMAFMIVLLANSINARVVANKKLSNNGNQIAMKEKVRNKMHIDFASALMGTFLNGLDDMNRQNVIKTVRSLGMELDIQHGPCPHGGENDGA
jgi:phage terminase large subunit-like protein